MVVETGYCSMKNMFGNLKSLNDVEIDIIFFFGEGAFKLVKSECLKPGTVPAQVYLRAIAWANCQCVHTSAVPYSLSTITCPAVELHNAASVDTPECDSQCLENPSSNN